MLERDYVPVERKFNQKMEFKKLEQRLQAIFRSTNEAIITTDNTGSIIFWNGVAEVIFGYKEDEVLGKHIAILVPEQYRNKLQATMESITSKKKYKSSARTIELYALRKDGSKFPIDLTLSTWRTYEGDFLTCVIRDITELKRLKKELQHSKRELTIRNQIANIFLTVPNDQVYGEVLQVVLESVESQYGVFGYLQEEDGSMFCVSMTRDVWNKPQIPEKDFIFPSKSCDDIWGQAMAEKRVIYSNHENLTEGYIHVSRVIDVPIIFHNKIIGNLLIGNKATDYDENDRESLEKITAFIAPILQARLQQDKQKKEQKKLQELQEHFIATTNHELRAPVTIIKGYIDFLSKKGNIPQKTIDQVYNRLESSINQLIRLINDVHDLSKVVNEIFDILPCQTNLDDFVRTIQEQCYLTYLDRPITVNYIAYVNENSVFIDQDRILQVIHNVTHNAIKNSSKGSFIEIDVIKTTKELKISIHDSGVGIPFMNLFQLFKPFSHLDTEYSTRGTGLGLFIVKNIVMGHGGYIEILSRENFGSSFTITIPQLIE